MTSGALAIIERELRRFRRSPTLMIVSMVFPLVQLVVLGYAFGGTVQHLRVAVVDEDHGVPALRVRELCGALASGAATLDVELTSDRGAALDDLRAGRLNGVLVIPAGYSRKALTGTAPHLALVEDNTDNFVSATLSAQLTALTGALGRSRTPDPRLAGQPTLDVVEMYPYVPYIHYLLPGSIVMSVFMMVMIGGGIMFIDDKARGLHEGYLVTPVTKLDLVAGFNLSGAIKAMLSGTVLMTVGSLIAGVPDPLSPARLLRMELVILVTALALVSLMFLFMVRVNDPLVPRATFGLLNTLLYFPSGAVYPTQGFPPWMQLLARVDPFTYAVHALKCLLLKDSGLGAVAGDLLFLGTFAAVAMTIATLLFKRTL